VSLASRRQDRGNSRQDDAKSSIVGLSGWLFADLLLALAVVFLVASDRPAESLATDAEVLDIEVEFSETESGPPISQIATIDESLSVWIRFSEEVLTDSFNLNGLQISREDEWSFRFVDRPQARTTKTYQIRLNPESARSAEITLTVKARSALSSERDNVWNKAASLSVSVEVCEALAGIAVKPSDTARFQINGGLFKSADEIVKWLSSNERKSSGTDRKSNEDEGFGDARLIWDEIQRPINERRNIGFAILFGGYVRNQESANQGQTRARGREQVVKQALRELGLLDLATTNNSSNCPSADDLPIRPFGDSGVGVNDLKFELYFYNNE
jgi:hypothetical protein